MKRTVYQIKDVASYDWSYTHTAPVLGKAVYAERFRNKDRVDAKEESVCHWNSLSMDT